MTTPAVNVPGADAIAEKWRELGGEAGKLGPAESAPEDSGFGALQRFRDGSIAWHEQFGAHVLFGAISVRWLERTRFQYSAFPIEDQRSVADGAGSLVRLRGLDPTGNPTEEFALCATSDGRASEIDGDIWQRWSDSGAESSPVGLPVDTAGTTIDGLGWRQEFQHGWMSWHPVVGVAMLHGEIADRWAELGFDRYGYPVADQAVLPDGRGQRAELVTLQADGVSAAGPLLYSTPEFGAWEVTGDIQTEWTRRGRETGEFGYPVGPPNDRADKPGVEQLFENGKIVWPPDPPGTPAPVVATGSIRSGGAAALGGRVTVQVNPDGCVQWSGHAHNSGADNYDYAVRALLRSPNAEAPTIVVGHSGSVYGTFHSGSRNDDWSEIIPSLDPDGSALLELLRGSKLETATEYESGIAGVLETIAGWAIKAAVAYTAGAGTIVLVFVGVEAGSLAATGSLLPGAQIINDMYWMAGPLGTLVSLGAQGLIAAGSQETEVTQEQYDWANDTVFKGALPPRELLRVTDWSGVDDRAFTFPRFDGKITLNMGRSGYPDPRDYHTSRPKPKTYGETFVHELVHACQAHHDKMGLSYLGKGISACVEGKASYNYPETADFDYTTMGLEAQASIVSDWYAKHYSSDRHGPWPDGFDDPFDRYITDNLRMGLF
ncbi:hypothetical protein KPL76_12890 [Subtercola sp. PAMC28395]|nr:hypothetical protein KPL76_12890 [Subtercola sp. PAMC28395]